MLALGPRPEVSAPDCEDDVDDPLTGELWALLGLREVLLHLWVVSGLLQDGSDAAAVVLRYIKVLYLAALDVLLQAAYDVYTGAHGQPQVLTFEEVDGHGVVGR